MPLIVARAKPIRRRAWGGGHWEPEASDAMMRVLRTHRRGTYRILPDVRLREPLTELPQWRTGTTQTPLRVSNQPKPSGIGRRQTGAVSDHPERASCWQDAHEEYGVKRDCGLL